MSLSELLMKWLHINHYFTFLTVLAFLLRFHWFHRGTHFYCADWYDWEDCDTAHRWSFPFWHVWVQTFQVNNHMSFPFRARVAFASRSPGECHGLCPHLSLHSVCQPHGIKLAIHIASTTTHLVMWLFWRETPAQGRAKREAGKKLSQAPKGNECKWV